MCDPEFSKSYGAGKGQIVLRTLSADLDTPVSAALKILSDQPYSFVLESVEGGATRGRYSFIGWAPDMLWRCQDGCAQCAVVKPGEPADQAVFEEEGKAALESLADAVEAAKLELAGLEDIPMPGLVGYLGYDMVRHVERLRDAPPKSIDMPDALLMRPT
ncbi:MAG: anthranilate synthase component I, partial [Pseudomonadota bacterium]